ncbi:uncharacterized protein C8Q71DRAFT_351923 [Rhodofomes roseus]|uniref:TIGR04076 family protein n=1 Tax=Rhodofomes roseus TaxID=34475 RepID=A0ABQ8KST4_9APHY|nr:uncharacterized protein C8Q71DRAFT_351923 [Rhodofomes roseus]KAH9841878.1 hypothetical protein C8Q71DRAFT_351923 [Rhodofomes roseus]
MSQPRAKVESLDGSPNLGAPDVDHSFQLYDLRVEVICPPGKRILCGAKAGDYFTLEGEMLKLPPGQGISIYSLGALLPLLAAKQRVTSPYDWMTTDSDIACPDPNCPSITRITRTGLRTFMRGDTTVGPLPPASTPSQGEPSRIQPAPDKAAMAVESSTPSSVPASPLFTDGVAEEDSTADVATAVVEEQHDLGEAHRGRGFGYYLRADWG